jgi:hypothetical protein
MTQAQSNMIIGLTPEGRFIPRYYAPFGWGKYMRLFGFLP